MELEQLFIELGYTKEEGTLIKKNYSLIRTSEEKMIKNIDQKGGLCVE